jgi:iron complex outermembrane receptor protein
MSTLEKYLNSRTFLSISIGLAIGSFTPLVSSQEYEENASEESIEKIMVTGSNIRRIDSTGTAPVQSIGRENIELTSIGTVSDLVINIPSNAGSVVNPVSGSNIGSSNFNLRNLGPGSTLVLINGRRAGKSPLGDSLGNQFYDLNQLPLSMIRTVDVQTDGASAIYGSEAVAGVVNLQTRKGFEGFEVSARYEDASNKTKTLNFALGTNSDKGSFAAYATAYKADINYRSDFDFIVDRSGGALTSSSGSPDEYTTLNPLTSERGSSKAIDPHCAEAHGTISGNTCRYNFFDHTSPVPKADRFAAFTEFDYSLDDMLGFEEISVYGELSYSNNVATRAIGPQTNGNGAYGGKFLIPSDHPFNFFVEEAGNLQYIDPTTTEGANFWQENPNAAANLTTSGSFRPIGDAIAGRNSAGSNFTNESDRRMIGLEAYRGDWNISTWYQSYEHKTTGEEAGNSIASSLQAALMNGNLNPFGIAYADPEFISPKNGESTAGHDIETYYRDIAHTETEIRTSSQETFDFIASNSEFMELGDGYVGVALGYQKRQETYSFVPDVLLNAGLGNSSSASFPSVSGKTDVDSVFVEMALSPIDDLEFQLALRYEDHGEEVGTTTDPKIAALWRYSEEMSFRGSYGSSFQAPSAIQTGGIAGSTGVDFEMKNERVTCNASDSESADFIVGTAAKVTGRLKPQSADNINLGLVWQPNSNSFMSVDYWRYDYKGLIVNTESAQTVLDNDCNDGVLNDPNIVRGSDGVPLFIATSLENSDSATTDGIDAKFNYEFTTDLGEIDLGMTISYVLSFDAVIGDTKIDAAGKRNATTNSFGAMPKLNFNMSSKWSNNNHQAIATLRYKDSYLQDDGARNNTLLGKNIDSFTTLDVQYSYDFSELFSTDGWVTAGVNNVFDEQPPEYGARPYYDNEVHPIRGRVMYLELGLKF